MNYPKEIVGSTYKFYFLKKKKLSKKCISNVCKSCKHYKNIQKINITDTQVH